MDSKGRVHEFLYSIRAAELMLENPGQFVCDATNLQVGFRVPGLAADEEFRRRRLYFLLPTDLLFSVLTEEEMAWLTRRAAGAATEKRRTRRKSMKTKKDDQSVRIFPAIGEFCLFSTDQMKERQYCDRPALGGDLMLKVRSWDPALYTIEEE